MARPKDFPRDELAALLRDPAVPPASIVEEMTLAGAEPIDAAALADARTLLATLTSPDAPVDPAAVQRLPATLRSMTLDAAIAARHLPLVEALAQSSDKQVVKDAKRAIHALRSQGVHVAAPKPVAAPEPAPVSKEEQPRAWLSLSDPAGERLVFVVQPARGGVDVAEVVLSDEQGIVDAHAAALTRKEWKRFMERLESKDGVLLAEVPRAYARWLICAAVDQADRRSLPIPSSFRSASFVLGPSVTTQPSPGRTLPVPADVDARIADATALLAHPALSRWSLPEAEHRKLNARRAAVEAKFLETPDDPAKAEQLATLRREGMTGYWTAAARKATADRLFDVAWLLKARQDVAILDDLLAVAAALDSDRPLDAIALTFALFDRPPPRDPLLPIRSILASA